MATTTALTENSRQGINFEIPPCIGLESWLRPNPHWGCGHAYDETPVGLVVYVRNDPVNYVDPSGHSPRGFHEDFTRVVVERIGLPGGSAIVSGASDADNFRYGTTGLFFIGGFFVNANRHFGEPSVPVDIQDPYLYGLDRQHTIQDHAPGAPHDLVGGSGYFSALLGELKHVGLTLIGRDPDHNIEAILAGARAAWIDANMREYGQPDVIPFPEDEIRALAQQSLAPKPVNPGFYDDSIVKEIMYQYSMPGTWNGDGPIGLAEGLALYEYQHGFGKWDPTYVDPWQGFHISCSFGGCLFN